MNKRRPVDFSGLGEDPRKPLRIQLHPIADSPAPRRQGGGRGWWSAARQRGPRKLWCFPPRQRSAAQSWRQQRQGKEAGKEAGESGWRAGGEPGAEFSTRGGGGQECNRAIAWLTEKERREPGHGHGRIATRQLGFRDGTAPGTPLSRPGTEPAGTPQGPKVSRLPSPGRQTWWRKAGAGAARLAANCVASPRGRPRRRPACARACLRAMRSAPGRTRPWESSSRVPRPGQRPGAPGPQPGLPERRDALLTEGRRRLCHQRDAFEW
ncbi:translation initiation factor IF-2-like [Aquila chrysaetos chrysaetos]|uniref:translation initiation factor IF-2-like n=1 Tax=Aquila chrysaetos chrysaetos TaxID=223781 RepID=UPI001176CC9E|nr:translation initiation factor IF-2-like [Aquila chrysaetos chrysaetos]